MMRKTLGHYWAACLGTAAFLGAAASFGSLASIALGDTVAYWRFEEKNGAPAVEGDFLRSTVAGGGTVSEGNTVDLTSDSSGNGNVLRTFHSPNDPNSPDGVQRLDTSPVYTLDRPALVIPRTLAPNNFAFDFDGAPGSDPPAPPDAGGDDIYTRDAENNPGPINSLVLNQYTIEGAFNVDTLGRYQSVVTKDGNVGDGGGLNPAGPLPPFTVKIFDNNTLNIETFDGSGAFRAIAADSPVAADTWYKFAVVNDGSNLALYLDSSDGNGYVLQSSQAPIAGGALHVSDDVWAIGRGWFFGPTDFFDGQIDEIRISDVALSPGEFLFSAIPEPSSLLLSALALAAGTGAVARGRRRG